MQPKWNKKTKQIKGLTSFPHAFQSKNEGFLELYNPTEMGGALRRCPFCVSPSLWAPPLGFEWYTAHYGRGQLVAIS